MMRFSLNDSFANSPRLAVRLCLLLIAGCVVSPLGTAKAEIHSSEESVSVAKRTEATSSKSKVLGNRHDRSINQAKWTLRTILGSKVVANVNSVSDKGNLSSSDQLPAKDLDFYSEIITGNKMLGTDPTVKRIDLVFGGSLQARNFKMKESSLYVETDSGEVIVPLEDVRAIVLKAKEGPEEQKSLADNPSSDTDRVLVQTSKGPRTVAGLIETLSSKELAIDYKDKVRSIEMSKIIAVYPASISDVGAKKRKPPKFTVTLIDHTVVYADSISLSSEMWTLTRKGQKSKVESVFVGKIRIQSDRMQYVANLPYKASPIDVMIAEPRETKKNRNVAGGKMRLIVPDETGGTEERTFDTGFGTHSTSRIEVELPAGFDSLRGIVGIDLSAGKRGICKCLILVDGTEVFSQSISGSKPASSFNLKLNGRATKLELVVLADQMMDLGDWVNWADLRILKTK